MQRVLTKSRWLGKITNFYVVEVVFMDVIIFYVYAVLTVDSFHYGHRTVDMSVMCFVLICYVCIINDILIQCYMQH